MTNYADVSQLVDGTTAHAADVKTPIEDLDQELFNVETGVKAIAPKATVVTLEEQSTAPTAQTGQVVVYAKQDGKLYAKDDAATEYDLTASGGASALNDLADVDAVGAANGEVLTFDGSQWQPQAVNVGASAIDDLSDVDTTGAANGDVLTFDGTEWQAQAASGGGASLPSGMVMPFAGATIPTGWLACDGAAISRSTYANLFAAIGTAYGAGNGSTTFNIPDLRGRTVIGIGQGTGLTNRVRGGKVGSETHQLTVNEMPSHKHGIGYGLDWSGQGPYNSGMFDWAGGNADTDYSGGNQPHNNMQPSLAMNYIIKS